MSSKSTIATPILITGGSGYIGSSLVNLLAGHRTEIRILSRTVPTSRPGMRHFAGDITSSILESAVDGVGTIFHLAGQTSVPQAEAFPERDRDVNLLAMTRLIGLIRRQGSNAAIIHAGTITQVGLPAVDTVDESMPDAPVTVYDWHKLEAERQLAAATELGYVRGVTLRLANVYGPGPTAGSPDRGILNMFMRQALAGEPLTMFGHGRYLRDYVYVGDVARAFVLAAEHATAIAGRHFVIGTGVKRTLAAAVNAVTEAVERRTGRAVVVNIVDDANRLDRIDRRSYVVDPSRFRQATAWAPRVSLEAGIEHTLDALAGAAGSAGRRS